LAQSSSPYNDITAPYGVGLYTFERSHFAQGLANAVENAIASYVQATGTAAAIGQAFNNLQPYDDVKNSSGVGLFTQEVLSLASKADQAIAAYVASPNTPTLKG